MLSVITDHCALRNGDARLKNFGIVYDDVLGQARLAPTYDLVSTAVYPPNDSMALTLNGTTKWPSAKELRRLGETRMAGTTAKVKQIQQRIDEAVAQTIAEVRSYIKQHSAFPKFVAAESHNIPSSYSNEIALGGRETIELVA